MRINWKRFSFGALLLASLSLLLFGCSDYSSTVPPGAATKSISGIASDPASGLPLAKATVTAYAVDANGQESSTPLSEYPASVTSDQNGAYQLQIPAGYSGVVVVEAQVPAGNALKQLARQLLQTGGTVIKSAVVEGDVALASVPPEMVSFATDAVVQYVNQNYSQSGGLTSANIRAAEAALEGTFGVNFTRIAPPKSATDAGTTRAQQDLLVMITAFNSVISASSDGSINEASIFRALGQAGGLSSLSATLGDSLKSSIQAAVNTLSTSGALPPEYTPSVSLIAAISNAQNAPLASNLDLSDTVAPSAPGNLQAALASSNSKRVNLNWSASTDNVAVAGYLICRHDDTSNAYAPIDMVGAGATSYSDTFTKPQTHYSYKVVAFDRGHNLSAGSNVAQVTTPLPSDGVAPAVPNGLVSNVSPGAVGLSWLPSTKTKTDGSQIPAASYLVYRNYQLIGITSDTFYSDASVESGKSYLYFVKAADAEGDLSAASQTLTVRTALAAGAPDAPTINAGATALSNKVTFSWSAVQGMTYSVWRDHVVIAAGLTVTSYSDSTVLPNSGYTYTVTATNAAGLESGESAGLTVNTPAVSGTHPQPSQPLNLLASAVSGSAVALVWSPSSMPDGSAVAGYEVIRDNVAIAKVRLPGYIDTTLSPATSYNYQIKAVSSLGVRSDASASLPVTTLVAQVDNNPPRKPVLTSQAYDSNSGGVKLSWSASLKSDNTTLAAGYLVYRIDGSGQGLVIAGGRSALFTDGSAPGGPYSYTDNTVVPGGSYQYYIVAFDSGLIRSAASDLLAAITIPAADPNAITVTGKVLGNGVGIPGIPLTLTANNGDGTLTRNVTSNANGLYVIVGVQKGVVYTLVPAGAPGSTLFNPASRIIVSSTNLTGQDFALFQAGAVMSGVTYPDGTIIGGISYGGSTVIGGVSYPTGTVIGGVSYPNGVVIGGVSYPAGTVVGGIAFPVGFVTANLSYPTGVVSGGVSYPSGGVSGGVGYPSSGVAGSIIFPSGTLIGGISYPSGSITGSLNWGP